MKLVADLHIHSHYSRATSKKLDFENLTRWAQIKGVNIVGSGDLSHPGWLDEMREKLEPAEEGLFKLRDEYLQPVQAETPKACHAPIRFLLTGEISNIYKRHDATRKVHNVVFAPTLGAVAKLQTTLEGIGNIRSDGRPILGLDSHDLLEIVLENDPRCHFIPAHIWTPWFSMLGSKSGFDSVEECFGDLSDHIFALETGLSSDPPMNWRVSNLDGYTLVSSSDAHSPQKLMREATVFDTERTYDALFDAMYTGDPATFSGTLEFFPEEGKYHLDGHRKCGIAWDPQTTREHDGICSVCGKKVTIGVMHRVDELADRAVGGKPSRTHPFTSLIPLPEVLSEVLSVGPNSKTVQRAYFRLLDALGSELSIMLAVPLEDIEAAGGERLAQGIGNMRARRVNAQGGYDGEYGVIKTLDESNMIEPQDALFPEDAVARTQFIVTDSSSNRAISSDNVLIDAHNNDSDEPPDAWTALPLFDLPPVDAGELAWLDRLNEQQLDAVLCVEQPLVISAGPGAGKTRTLTVRIANLVRAHDVAPESILALTFTNRAENELSQRLQNLLGEELTGRITGSTFHKLGLQLLREFGASIGLSDDFTIANNDELTCLIALLVDGGRRDIRHNLDTISLAKGQLLAPQSDELAEFAHDLTDFPQVYSGYEQALRDANLVDLDDLIVLAVRLLETNPQIQSQLHERYRWISVDEYQDVNLAQYRLLRLLVGEGANLCVIGDPDQAIYGFRGADYRFFQTFAQDYPQAKTVHLQQSYRSPQMLLDAALQVISKSANHDAIKLFSGFTEQVKIDSYCASTDKAEAEYVVHRIEQMVGGTSFFSMDSGRVDDTGLDTAATRTFDDFAVLYRLNSQSRSLLEAFERSGIPFQCAGPASGLDSPGAHLLLDYLRLANAPTSHIQWATCLKYVLPKADMNALGSAWQQACRNGASVAECYDQVYQRASLSKQQRNRLDGLRTVHLQLLEPAQNVSVVQTLDTVRDFLAGYVEVDEAEFDTLRRRAGQYADCLTKFLDALALLREADGLDPRADRVSLMTMHAAKGLEFPVVFIVGCEDGLLPYRPPSETRKTDLEEERRLFYVGMTRAQQKLIFTRSQRRMIYGKREELAQSPYVSDIEAALMEVHEQSARPNRARKSADFQIPLFG